MAGTTVRNWAADAFGLRLGQVRNLSYIGLPPAKFSQTSRNSHKKHCEQPALRSVGWRFVGGVVDQSW